MKREDLVDCVRNALAASGGGATITDVAKHIWKTHESELQKSGDLFFTWQYDMRWAAQKLRDTKKAKTELRNGKSYWSLL